MSPIPDYILQTHSARCDEAEAEYRMLPAEIQAIITRDAFVERYVNALPPLMWTGGTAA